MNERPNLQTSRELRAQCVELLKKSAEIIKASKAAVGAAEAAQRDTRELLELLRSERRSANKRSIARRRA